MRALQVKQDHPDYIQPESFQRHARDWGKLFMELFYDDDLTPYIHGMIINFCIYSPSHKQIHVHSSNFFLKIIPLEFFNGNGF